MMSFSKDVKEEILRHFPEKSCCRKALLGTFFSFGGAENSLLTFRGAAMARFLVLLLKKMRVTKWGMGISAGAEGTRHAGRLILGEKIPQLRSLAKPWPACCLRSFLKGAFLIKGSIVSPQKSYHIEITALGKKEALAILRFWERTGFSGGTYCRNGKWVAFLKGGDQVARFLSIIGADQSFLRFEEIRAIKETKNEVHRHVNYESANLGRMVTAARRQKILFQKLMVEKAWKTFPLSLRKAAEERIKHSSLSLQELAYRLCISKSALNHRFRRLEAFGKERA